MALKTSESVEAYIAAQPKATQPLLKKVRATIRAAAPEADEALSYGIPTFDLYGHLIHFAGYERHIGLYPGPAAITAFKRELASHKTSKGAIQLSLDKALPLGLITKIVKYRVAANLEKAGRLFPKTSAPAARAMQNAGINTLKDLSRWSEKQLLELHGIGPTVLPILGKALKVRGLKFRT